MNLLRLIILEMPPSLMQEDRIQASEDTDWLNGQVLLSHLGDEIRYWLI